MILDIEWGADMVYTQYTNRFVDTLDTIPHQISFYLCLWKEHKLKLCVRVLFFEKSKKLEFWRIFDKIMIFDLDT